MNSFDKSLSDFCNMEVIRSGSVAQIIFDYVDGRPVRLLGFFTDASKSNFEIQEEAFEYYNKMIEELNNQ